MYRQGSSPVLPQELIITIFGEDDTTVEEKLEKLKLAYETNRSKRELFEFSSDDGETINRSSRKSAVSSGSSSSVRNSANNYREEAPEHSLIGVQRGNSATSRVKNLLLKCVSHVSHAAHLPSAQRKKEQERKIQEATRKLLHLVNLPQFPGERVYREVQQGSYAKVEYLLKELAEVGKPALELADRAKHDGHILGAGGFGCVLKVVDTNANEVRAMKVMAKRELHKEQNFLALLQLSEELTFTRAYLPHAHPNLATIFESFQDERFYYMVMECGSGMDLFDFYAHKRQRIGKDNSVIILNGILRGLFFMHSHGLAHGDIKMENVLVDYDPSTKRVVGTKLCDFGYVTNRHTTSGVYGARGAYNPPEGRQPNQVARHPAKDDIWAFGVIAAMLLLNLDVKPVLSVDQWSELIRRKASYDGQDRNLEPFLTSLLSPVARRPDAETALLSLESYKYSSGALVELERVEQDIGITPLSSGSSGGTKPHDVRRSHFDRQYNNRRSSKQSTDVPLSAVPSLGSHGSKNSKNSKGSKNKHFGA